MHILVAILTLLLACPAFAGSTGGLASRITFRGESSNARVRARGAAVHDLQNYCSSVPVGGTPTTAELAIGPRMLDLLAKDVIAWGPTFVLQEGDIADQAGADASGDASDPDNFLTNSAAYAETTCVKTHFFDKLDAAGIPWIAASGNHDSYRDFERQFPRTAWLAKTYAVSSQREIDRWHAGYDDTEERTALFQTPIGTICVVVGDYALDPAGGSLDTTYFNNAVGCSASRPTIALTHAGVIPAPLAAAGNNEIFLSVFGHETPTVPGTMQRVTSSVTAGGFEVIEMMGNEQELSMTCGSAPAVAGDGSSVHTGMTWWTMIEIVPAQNAIIFQARNPFYGGRATDPACGDTYTNTVVTLSPSFCTRFAGGPGC